MKEISERKKKNYSKILSKSTRKTRVTKRERWGGTTYNSEIRYTKLLSKGISRSLKNKKITF